jgi:Domain of unknown function (DUF5655)
MSDWVCPKCRRRFVQKSAKHACVRLTEAQFFKGHPRPRALFRELRKLMATVGAAELDVTRSQIAFRGRTRFAWAWLPQKWLRSVPPEALVLTLDLRRRLRSKRFKEVVEARPGRFTHHLVLYDQAQLDPELRRWLAEAWRGAQATVLPALAPSLRR